MQLIQPNNKKISSKNIRNKLRAQSCKGRALRDSKFVSERQTNKHRQEIKTNIPLTQVRKYMKKPTNLIFSDTCQISLNTSPPRVKCDRYKMWQIAKIPPPMPQKRVTFTNYFFFNFRLQKCSPPTNLLCLSTFITILIMTSLFIHPWPDCLSLCAWSMFCNFL